MPPLVAPLDHRHVLLGALNHQHGVNGWAGPIGQGSIDGWLQRNRFVFSEAAIGGDHRLHLAINQPIPQRFGREAPKHHGMGRPNTGTSEHRNRRFRDHRHVKRHQVALAEAHGLQGIGSLTDLGMQFAIGEATHIARLSLPDQRCLVGRRALKMPIEAVERQVGGAPLKPAGEGGIAPIQNRMKWLKPMQFATGGVSPKAVRISLRRIGHGPVSLKAANRSLCRKARGRFEHTLLLQHAFDRCVGVRQGRLNEALIAQGKEQIHGSCRRLSIRRMPLNRLTRETELPLQG